MVKGRVVSFDVRLVAIEGDLEYNVARYDTVHGVPHRDVLGRNKQLTQKEWYLDVTIEKMLKIAVDDFKLNCGNYIEKHKKS